MTQSPLSRQKSWPRTGILIVLMTASIVAVALLTYQDVKRRYAESMEDYARTQETLARGVASELGARIALARREARLAGQAEPSSGRSLPMQVLSPGLAALEQPGSLVLLILRPQSESFQSPDGHSLSCELLLKAVRSDARTLRIPREVAAQLGLPRRVAVAGLAPLTTEPSELW